ncbi:hypothetical protein BD309DRAFT_1024264 [Dichomitus squalens]|nr:hypothetical protein BD309DRAFT_1024264 [Dichomitus squalens]
MYTGSSSTKTTESWSEPWLWDIRSACDAYILADAQKNPTIQIHHVVLNRVHRYAIQYDADRDAACWWDLVVDAPTALELYRRRGIRTSVEAVRFLADRGTPFNTLFEPDSRYHFVLARPIGDLVSWRVHGFVPNSCDYSEYERRAYHILCQPKGRAALLRGGIVWRIAVEILGDEWRAGVLSGPSDDVYRFGATFVQIQGVDGLDDSLSPDQLDVICGVYREYTANVSLSQTQDTSWWPKAEVWDGSDMDAGYWTPYCEHWFQTGLNLIRKGEARLRTSSKWRGTLKVHKHIKNWRRAVATASHSFLQERICIRT